MSDFSATELISQVIVRTFRILIKQGSHHDLHTTGTIENKSIFVPLVYTYAWWVHIMFFGGARHLKFRH